MNKYLAALLVFVSLIVAVYGAGVFIAQDFNPGNWTPVVRFLAALFTTIGTAKIISAE